MSSLSKIISYHTVINFVSNLATVVNLHSLLYCAIVAAGPPSHVVVVGCTVIWKPPEIPNGVLLGYTIRVYPVGSVGQSQTVNKSADDFYHAFTNIPAGDNLQVQVTRVIMTHIFILDN